MKILFANCGYLTGLTGQLNEYVFLIWRYIFESTPVSMVLIDTIKKEDPDVCVFVEMKKKSISVLAETLPEYTHQVTVEKYGKGLLSRVAKRNVHAVISKKPFDNIEKILLSFGTKKTILHVTINDISVYICHLSLVKSIRQKQIQELAVLTEKGSKVIVAGDFNVFGGISEVKPFMERGAFYNLNQNNTPTFPSFNPKKQVDYIFASHDLTEESFVVLPEVFSDHRALYCVVE